MRASNLVATLVATALTACSPSSEPKPEEALGIASNSSGSPKQPTKRVGQGPFGLTFGMAVAEVAGATPLEQPGFYEIKTPPKPHPDFERVVLVAYPETGICLMRGVGRTIEGDGSGDQVISKVDSLAEALSTKYGGSTKFDNCSGGDIQCDGQFWMMTLNGGERSYGHKWTSSNEAMKSNRIGEIYVAAAAANIQSSFPMIEFHSDKKQACDAAEKASSVSAL